MAEFSTKSTGAVQTGFTVLQGNQWRAIDDGAVIEEAEFCIYVNGRELVTLAATPVQLEALAIGFLANEGFITSLEDVRDLGLKGQGYCIDVWLNKSFTYPERAIRTSGCTGGITFDQLARQLQPLQDQPAVSVTEIRRAARALYDSGHLYRLTRGVHTSILWRDGELLAAAEDVGRHNTLDKLRGLCMIAGVNPAGSLVLSTGRISSEMLTKAANMGCAVVVSRTSATSMSVRLAREWNMTLVGYLRNYVEGHSGWQMVVYSHPRHLLLEG